MVAADAAKDELSARAQSWWEIAKFAFTPARR
jgi:hypothetical protein